MISNTLLLFFAGLENGAANMAITAWALAKNPDVQEKLYKEIQEAIANNPEAEDEKIGGKEGDGKCDLNEW